MRPNKGPVLATAGLGGLLLLGIIGLVIGIMVLNVERQRTIDALGQVTAQQAKTQLALAAETKAREAEQQARQQAMAAHERAMQDAATKATAKLAVPATPRPVSPAKPRKLSHREQQEWEGIETAITAAEELVVNRQAEVELAATAGHAALADACLKLEEAQRAVERLYERWQELETKRGS